MSFVDNEGLHPGYEEDIEAIKAGTLTFRAIKAKKAADLTNFTVSYNGFSGKFLELLRENGIANFQAHELVITYPEDCPPYYLLEIECSDMPIASTTARKSSIYETEGGTPIDVDDWGGEDLFTIKGSTFVCCTERLKQLIEKAKLRNFNFEEFKPRVPPRPTEGDRPQVAKKSPSKTKKAPTKKKAKSSTKRKKQRR